MIRYLPWCVVFFLPVFLYGQADTGQAVGHTGRAADVVPAEIDFIRYMMSRGDHNEALFLLEDMQSLTPSQADTVAYLKGWALYQQNVLFPSAMALLKVSEQSPYFLKSRFFAAYNMAHAGHVSRGRQILGSLAGLPDGMHQAMQNFQLGGMALLERDYTSFQTHVMSFTESYQAFARQEPRLVDHYQALLDVPVRSPFIAGLLSAAVPGLGKVYAGKTGEGIAGFLYTLSFGATAYDFYRGAGPQSALFIISASVAGIFYIGNIWGSMVAVNRIKQEFHYEIDQRILFDLHIPLRNAFN